MKYHPSFLRLVWWKKNPEMEPHTFQSTKPMRDRSQKTFDNYDTYEPLTAPSMRPEFSSDR